MSTNLSTEVLAVMDAWEMSAEPQDKDCIRLIDLDGNYHATVSSSINVRDLTALLRYGEWCRKEGKRQGADDLKCVLRQMIGAAPLEP